MNEGGTPNCLLRHLRRPVHDIASGTIVVDARRVRELRTA